MKENSNYLRVSERLELSRVRVTEGKITGTYMKEIQEKLILVHVSARFELWGVACIIGLQKIDSVAPQNT